MFPDLQGQQILLRESGGRGRPGGAVSIPSCSPPGATRFLDPAVCQRMMDDIHQHYGVVWYAVDIWRTVATSGAEAISKRLVTFCT